MANIVVLYILCSPRLGNGLICITRFYKSRFVVKACLKSELVRALFFTLAFICADAQMEDLAIDVL